MLLVAFAHGLGLGLAVAAPVGPIGLLCMRRTLSDGFRAGFLSGLGAATADSIYAAVAAFGLVTVAHLLVGVHGWLEAGGGVALIYLGMKTLLAPPAARSAAARGGGLLALYSGTVALTLANPTTILSFVALFAGAGLGGTGSGAPAALLVTGVGCGSALWWLLLLGVIALLRTRMPASLLRGVTRVAGAALVLLGLLALVSAAIRV